MHRISIAGTSHTFLCAEDDTVLRAALREGLGLQYECNIGACGSCRIEVADGRLEHVQKRPGALTERDIARNRMLSCQAHPLSDCTIKARLNERYRSRYRPLRNTAELISIQDHTHDMREFRFRLDIPNGFCPGQYALLELPGVEGARAYSMCNVSPTGAEWHFLIKRVLNGTATTVLFKQLTCGARIKLDGPYGMAFLREDSSRDVLCLAGGSGLAPMISIARAFALGPAFAGRTLRLLYGGREPRDIAGLSMLQDLPGFAEKVQYHAAISMPESAASSSWTGAVGFVHEVASNLWSHSFADMEIYFAGPPMMADAVLKVAEQNRVPFEQIHFDRFY